MRQSLRLCQAQSPQKHENIAHYVDLWHVAPRLDRSRVEKRPKLVHPLYNEMSRPLTTPAYQLSRLMLISDYVAL